MSKAFDNGKRNVSSRERSKQLEHLNNYKFAKNLAKDRCDYIGNKSLNSNFTIEYKYTNDSLISEIRNVGSYDFLYSISKGYNLCDCNGKEYNVQGNLYEIQKYGYEDLSGITLYDICGNKLFDEYFYDACGLTDYTKYDVVNIKNKSEILTEKSLFLSNFKLPTRIILNEEYAKPRLSIISVIPFNNYVREIPTINILTTVDECFSKTIEINNIIISLLRKIIVSSQVTPNSIEYVYGLEEQPSSILQGTLISGIVDSKTNNFDNVSIHKPGLNYIFKFTNEDVQDICSNFFNVYGKLDNIKGDGFNNSEISNDIFVDSQTTNQGATNGEVIFVPTISGDYFYQSQYNNDIYGTINIFEAPVNHVDISHIYTLQLETTSTTETGKQYVLTLSGETQSYFKPDINAYIGDTIIFDILNTIITNPLWIQTSQGAKDGITIIEDFSGIIGVAGKTINSISMEILDNIGNKFTTADNEIQVKIDPTTNPNSAILYGSTKKYAEFGTIQFDDLSLNKPGTNFKFVFYTEEGEIGEFTSPEFDILGEIQQISTTPLRTFYVGETINNIGSKILLSEFDNTTEMIYTISNGELNTESTYTNDFTASLLGPSSKILVNGEMLIDNSINKIGNNYNIIFDASNTTEPFSSANINIIGKLDLSNITYVQNQTPKYIAGTDLSNFEVKLLDVSDNIIPFNSPTHISIKYEDVNGNINTLFNKTLNISDGSLSLVDVSINISHTNYYLEINVEHGDGSKNTVPFDIFANSDISSQPLLYANRIVASDYMPVSFSSKNINNEPIPEVISYDIDTTDITKPLLGNKRQVSNVNGVVEFRNIEFFKSSTDTSYNKHQLVITGTNSYDNIEPFTTDKFYILYTNWNNTESYQIAPNVKTLNNDDTDYYIQLDQHYRPYDNSYVILLGSTPESNNFWKTNTTNIPGNAYMRSFVWDISNENVSAGGIYRIQRKLYTTASDNTLYNSDAEFSFTPINEVEMAIANSRSPYTYYYDYSFNTNILSRSQHAAFATSMSYDTSKYDSRGWHLTTIRSQEESDYLSYKLKRDAPDNENINYYIGGELSTHVYGDLDPLAAGPYGHIIYRWDTYDESNNFIWVGNKTVLLPS